MTFKLRASSWEKGSVSEEDSRKKVLKQEEAEGLKKLRKDPFAATHWVWKRMVWGGMGEETEKRWNRAHKEMGRSLNKHYLLALEDSLGTDCPEAHRQEFISRGYAYWCRTGHPQYRSILSDGFTISEARRSWKDKWHKNTVLFTCSQHYTRQHGDTTQLCAPPSRNLKSTWENNTLIWYKLNITSRAKYKI